MPKASSRPSNSRNGRMIPWLMAVIVAAVAPYVPSLQGAFVLDDGPLIVRDPLAHSLANIPQAFGTDFLHGALGDELPYYYRPLITISYQANYSMSGPDAFAFRLTNLLLNLVVVLMVFALARRLSRSSFVAGIAAIAFAVLPSHAESVAWVSGRTDVIAALFSLGCLLAFIANYNLRPRFSWPLAVLCSVMFAGGLFSKETGLAIPVLMAAYVWVFGSSIRRNELAKWAVVLLPPLLVFIVLRSHVVGGAFQESLMIRLGQRIAGVGIAYAAYLRMLFIPQELRVMYDVFPIGIRYPMVAAAAWLLPVGLVALSVWARKRLPIISFGALWVFLGLLPTSNIIPTIGWVPAERFVYLASVGSSIVIGWVAWRVYQWRPEAIRVWPTVTAVLIIGFVLYCAALTVQSCQHYQSDLAWARAIVASKTRFHVMRATAAANLLRAGYPRDAAREYETAFSLARNGEMIMEDYVGLAVARRRLGQLDVSVDVLITGLSAVGDKPELYYHLGIDYAVLGDMRKAASAFRRATELNPDFALAWRNLGKAELRLGRFRESIAAYRRTFAYAQPSASDRLDLAAAYKGAGDHSAARTQLDRILRDHPRSEAGRKARAELRSLETQPRIPDRAVDR